ncbi:MAG: hypothetical protein U0527_07735 [Candidatus Eisenbacteria bacterium]
MDQRFGLEDSLFWSKPHQNDLALMRATRDAHFSGVRVDAPTFIPIDTRTTCPLLVQRCGPERDLWAVDFSRHGLVVLSSTDTRVVRAEFALDQDFADPEEPVDPADAPDGYGSQAHLVELRELLSLPWNPARYATFVVMREHRSNAVLLHLGRSGSAFDDPEVEAFLERERAKASPGLIHPPLGRPVPTYKRLDVSPPIPDEPGIALTVERVVALKPGAQCLVRGSFRLPVLPQERVTGRYEGHCPEGDPTALLSISLLVTGGDRATPTVLPLAIPTFDPLDRQAARPIATGYFCFDLLSFAAMSHDVQTYFVYAIAGEFVTGPAPAALVSPDSLETPRRG